MIDFKKQICYYRSIMIISDVAVRKNGRNSTLSAHIAFRGQPVQKIYFKTSKTYEAFVAKDATPFLAAVLIPCMKTHENIYIDGCASEELLKKTSEIVTILSKKHKKLYRVKIRCRTINKDTGNALFTGCFFTAGIDSFYSYLRNKKQKKSVTHLILTHGEIQTKEKKSLVAAIRKTVQEIAGEEKIKTITVETNIATMLGRILSQKELMLAVALFLRRGFKKIIIPDAKETGFFTGQETLWSTEKLQLVYDGRDSDTLEKVITVVGKSSLALKHLQVCPQNTSGNRNCSVCDRCLIVMIMLTCAGALKKSGTFDTAINVKNVRTMNAGSKISDTVLLKKALLLLQKKRNNKALCDAIRYNLKDRKKQPIVKHVIQFIAQWDHKHTENTLQRFVFNIDKTNDF
jgi:hypothetical protein